MKYFTTEAKVGVFAIIGVLVIVWMATTIEDIPFRSRGGQKVWVFFPNVAGVLEKTPVEVAGIKVGHVARIALEGSKAKLLLVIDRRIPIYEDTQVQIEKRGLLGERVIRLGAGGKAPLLPDGGTLLTGSEAFSVEQAMSDVASVVASVKNLIEGKEGQPSLRKIVENVGEMSEDLRTTVKQNSDNINAILENISVFSDDLRAFGEKSGGNLNELVANFKDISVSLKEVMSTASPELKRTMTNISGFTERLDRTIARVEAVVAKVERGEGTLGKLMTDEKTIDNLNDALEGINTFVGKANRLETAFGYRGEYLADSKTIQSVVSIVIRPRKDKYFLLEVVDSPIRVNRYRTKETITTTDGTTTVTEVEKKRTSDLLFNLQIAKRFYDLTVRFGVFRSTGGVALDYFLFWDHLVLTAEAFDFGRDERFRLRAFVTLYFWKVFFLTAGGNDLVVRGGERDWFGGGGILFTDEDLKTLFTTLSFGTFR